MAATTSLPVATPVTSANVLDKHAQTISFASMRRNCNFGAKESSQVTHELKSVSSHYSMERVQVFQRKLFCSKT
jgi:hypothetical protein